jgi:hypothetical protein
MQLSFTLTLEYRHWRIRYGNRRNVPEPAGVIMCAGRCLRLRSASAARARQRDTARSVGRAGQITGRFGLGSRPALALGPPGEGARWLSSWSAGCCRRLWCCCW